jgi:hypothetical protein
MLRNLPGPNFVGKEIGIRSLGGTGGGRRVAVDQ